MLMSIKESLDVTKPTSFCPATTTNAKTSDQQAQKFSTKAWNLRVSER